MLLHNMLWHKTRFIAGSVLLLFSTLWPGLSLTEEAERQGTETAIKRDRPYQLPSIHSNYGVLTQQQEAAIGQAWLQNIQSELNLFEDVLIADYLQHLIYDLSVAMKLTNYRFHLLLIDDKRINAFAVPGGIIGINTGLIIHADHADELASVLAHELAHLKQKHFLRNLEYLQATQNQNLTALLIGIGFFITGQADIGLATIYGNATAKQDQILAYSRDFETEADLLAQQTMQARGYRPDATIRFMEKLQQDVNNNLVLPEFLSTHPVTEKRIAALQERLLQNNFNKEQKYQPPVTDATYPYLRMRLLARYKISPQSFITTELETFYHLLTMEDKQKAITRFRQLLKKNPDHLIYTISLAELLLQTKKIDAAVTLLEKSQQLNPQNYPLSIYLISAYQQQNNLKAAADLLSFALTSYPESTALWEKRAAISQAQQDLFSFHMAKAKIFAVQGQIDLAIKQTEQARLQAHTIIEQAQAEQAIQLYQDKKQAR